MTLSTIKRININSSLQPKNLDDEFDWEERLSKQEEQLYNVALKLLLLEEITLKNIYLKKEIDCGMLQPKDKIDYPMYFHEHQPREALILDEVVDIIVKDKKIVRWTVMAKEQLVKFNLGNEEEPKEVLINAILPSVFQAQIRKVLMEHKNVFAWSYKELIRIPREVCEHKIELMVNV